MSHSNNSLDADRPKSILKRKHKRGTSAAYSPNHRALSKSRTQYLYSIWIKFMMLSFAFQVFNVLTLKCDYERPRGEFLRVPHRIVCTLRASQNFILVRLDRLMTFRREKVMGHGGWVLFDEPWNRFRRQTSTESFCTIFNRQPKRDFNSTSGGPKHQQEQQQGSKTSGFNFPGLKYFRSLKWTPIPISVGLVLIAYQHYRRVLRRGQQEQNVVNEENISQNWEITCYRMIPWKTLSRCWGWVNSVDLPVWARPYILNWYIRAFGCDVSEAHDSDLCHYHNLGEFFRRPLKTGVRPVDHSSPVVSPADGTILHFGSVECGKIEQVKGVTYSISTFIGPKTWADGNDASSKNVSSELPKLKSGCTKEEEFCSILTNKISNVLHYCVIYLAPGDYHRFHSPANWDMTFRRHFAGELLSVNPKVAGWISGLFSLNERAVYVGKWEHGFFSMTAVGATNVGSIHVYGDPDLQTNSRRVKKNTHVDKTFEKSIHFKKGDGLGEFNLGSTIVLLFEAPPSFKFNIQGGQKVKVGQALSC